MAHHPEVQRIVDRHPQPADVLLAKLGNAALSPNEEMLVSLVARLAAEVEALGAGAVVFPARQPMPQL